MKKKWQLATQPPQDFLDEHSDLHPVVASLLYHRDIRTKEAIEEFLTPRYEKHVHDPFLFQDMDKAVSRIFDAIEKGEMITVYGDYDADGVCASTILVSTLKSIGAARVDAYLPHRETDGYGLNKKSVSYLADEGTTLLITCDCGISNTEEIALGNEKKMDTIVTDHHAIPETLPEAYAIIHPRIEGEPYPDKGLCGAAVAFKLAQALLAKHKEMGRELATGERHEAAEKWHLGLVAVASVADLVPLLGESRTLTKYGLIVLNKSRRLGLKKMLLEAKLMHDDGSLTKEIDTRVIGFQIAPRINAAGRLNHANVAYKLLMTEDPIEAIDLAFELEKNNSDRRTLVDKLLEEAELQVMHQTEKDILIVKGSGWPTGVVGLIASRLKEKYYKPSIAMGFNDGLWTGSGRSIPGFNMIEALQEIPHFFSKFGGHPMACGFTLADPNQVSEFHDALCALYTKKTEALDMSAKLHIDAEMPLDQINWESYERLSSFEPFGKDNEKPLYMASGVEVNAVNSMGKSNQHMRLFLKQNNTIKKAVGWNLCLSGEDKTNWCATLSQGDLIDVVFDLDINEWNGNRELQLTIHDLRKHES